MLKISAPIKDRIYDVIDFLSPSLPFSVTPRMIRVSISPVKEANKYMPNPRVFCWSMKPATVIVKKMPAMLKSTSIKTSLPLNRSTTLRKEVPTRITNVKKTKYFKGPGVMNKVDTSSTMMAIKRPISTVRFDTSIPALFTKFSCAAATEAKLARNKCKYVYPMKFGQPIYSDRRL